MKTTAALAASGCVVFLLFFRPELAFTAFGNLDPQCYLAQLHALLGIAGPRCESSAFLPGTALVWWPGAALALFVSHLTGAGADGLIRVSVGVTSFGLWVGALFLIHGLLAARDPGARPGRSLLWILSVPVLYYAAARTMLSHSVEFFLACLTAFLVVKKRYWWALGAAGLSCLTRFNDLPWLLVVGAAAWQGRLRRPAWWAAWTTIFSFFASWAAFVGLVAGYHEVRLPFLVSSSSWERFLEVLVGTDWGLLWMSPWWLLVLAAALRCARKLSPIGAACACFMGMNLALCVSWRGNGGDFGYRYLVGTFPAALLLWLELEPGLAKWRLPASVSVTWGALWTTYLTWIYRSRPELTPMKPTDDWGAMAPDFQWHALLTLLDPTRWAAPLLKSPAAALWNANLLRAQWWVVAALTLSAALFLVGYRSRRRQ